MAEASRVDRYLAGLPADRQDFGPRVIEPVCNLVILDAVDNTPKLLKAHRGTIAVGHDQRAVGRSVDELVALLDGRYPESRVRAFAGELRTLEMLQPSGSESDYDTLEQSYGPFRQSVNLEIYNS